MPDQNIYRDVASRMSQGPFQQALMQTTMAKQQPTVEPSGWESKGTAVGEIALSFFDGIRRGRVEKYLKQEAAEEKQQKNFFQQASMAQSMASTPEQKEKIAKLTMDAWGRVGQFNVNKAGGEKGGKKGNPIMGVAKNIFTGLSGGELPKGEEPLNVKMYSDLVGTILSGPSATTQAEGLRKQIVDQLGKADPNAGREAVVSSVAPLASRLRQLDPNADNFLNEATGKFFKAAVPGTPEAIMREEAGAKPTATAPPPTTPTVPPMISREEPSAAEPQSKVDVARLGRLEYAGMAQKRDISVDGKRNLTATYVMAGPLGGKYFDSEGKEIRGTIGRPVTTTHPASKIAFMSEKPGGPLKAFKITADGAITPATTGEVKALYGRQPTGRAGQDPRVLALSGEALKASGGDVTKARKWMSEQPNVDKSVLAQAMKYVGRQSGEDFTESLREFFGVQQAATAQDVISFDQQ
jgi:hypothetical protein